MTAGWAGAIFKYYPARVKDDLLYDSGEVSDPDFCSNSYEGKPLPVWAICGVFHRRDVPAKGGMIFFVPVQNRWKETGLDDYICTGILVSAEKIHSKEQFLQDSRFDRAYLERYMKGLTHPKDKPRVKQLRERNIVVGNPSRSVWFGRNNVSLCDVLMELDLSQQAKALTLRNPSIPRLLSEESESLYDVLTSHIKQVTELLRPERSVPFESFGESRNEACGCDEDDEEV